jgi:uncharacterized membrane protein
MSAASHRRKLSRILLVGSLAVNLLLVGLIIGALTTGRTGPSRGFEPQLGPLAQVLPKRDRAEIGREIRRGLRRLDRSGLARSAAMAEVLALLEADKFDADAFAETIRDQQVWQDQVRDVALTAFVSHINTLPVERRLQVAQTLRDRLSRDRPGRDGEPTGK